MPNGKGKKRKAREAEDAPGAWRKRKGIRGRFFGPPGSAKWTRRAPGKGLKGISPGKAKFILREGVWNDKKLTKRQRGMLGVIAGGGKLTRLKKQKKARRK